MTTTKDEERRKIIASRAQSARKMAGLSQAEAAELLALKRSTLSDIESGKRKLSDIEVGRMVDVYDVTFEFLLGVGAEKYDPQEGDLLVAARILQKLKPEDQEKLMAVLASKKGKS